MGFRLSWACLQRLLIDLGALGALLQPFLGWNGSKNPLQWIWHLPQTDAK